MSCTSDDFVTWISRLRSSYRAEHYWCQAILARMIKDAQRFFRDHQEVLSIAGTVSSAWKLPGTKGAC